MRRPLGMFILTGTFGLLFTLTAVSAGFWGAVATWLGGALLALLLIAGIVLIEGDR